MISLIRTTAFTTRTRANITIDSTAIDIFLHDIQHSEWTALAELNAHGIRLPLRFDSNEEELNIISMLSLLNFLSGYRTPLHRLTTRGSYSTILSLVLSAHLSATSPASSYLCTAGMIKITPQSLAGLCQISLMTEKPHPTLGPAVRMGERDAEAYEIVTLLARVMNETGKILKEGGWKDLGEWMKEALILTKGDAELMLEKIAAAFPAFNDVHTIDDQPVYIFKKALFLLHAISSRFSPKSASSLEDDVPADATPVDFPLPDITGLPIFADNVIPTMLVHFNILSLADSNDPSLASGLSPAPAPAPAPVSPSTDDSTTKKALPVEGKLLSSASATRLRASAIDVCSVIVSRAHALALESPVEKGWMKGMTEVELDGYIWGRAKIADLREVPRFVERDTVFY